MKSHSNYFKCFQLQYKEIHIYIKNVECMPEKFRFFTNFASLTCTIYKILRFSANMGKKKINEENAHYYQISLYI